MLPDKWTRRYTDQLVYDADGLTEHRYTYDNRRNLIRKLENGTLSHASAFGAMNRMTGAMLSTVVFMVAPSIATAIVGAGASVGTITAVTIGVVAVGNFGVGASMSVLDDYANDVEKNEMLKKCNN